MKLINNHITKTYFSWFYLGLFLFAILLSAGCKAKKDDHILDNWVDYQIVSSIIVLLLFKYII